MGYDEEFMKQQMSYNGIYNHVICVMIVVVEGSLILAYFLSQGQGIPSLAPGYLWFYLSAVGAALAFWALDRVGRHCKRLQSGLRLTALNAILIWASLCSAFEVSHGNSGWAFPQVLLFTSAGLRLPGLLQYGLNTANWLFYVVILSWIKPVDRIFFSEVINSGLFLLISCIVIYITTRFQYASFLSATKQIHLRNAQLDAMAEQVEQMRELSQNILVVRHDLRHYAWEVAQGVARRDIGAVDAVTKQLLARLDQDGEQLSVRKYTGIAAYDAILTRYEQWTGAQDVSFQVEMAAPQAMALADFSLLFMNALENAALAVKAQGPVDNRFIRIQSGSAHGQYFLEIANTYPSGYVPCQDGGLPAAKEPGHGYGIRSMVSVLERYDAVYRFQAQDGIFKFLFLLPYNEAEERSIRRLS